jgi:hypothetical protein
MNIAVWWFSGSAVLFYTLTLALLILITSTLSTDGLLYKRGSVREIRVP